MSSVLLAEDEFLIRAVVVDALAAVGIDCIEAATGQAALDIISGAATLCAIIVDIGLPDMSGERVIEAALRHRPDVPIIRCSGSSAPPALSSPRIHAVPKPYSVDDLAKLVTRLVGKA
jgi:CheY-like chemotaxis protein